MIAGVKISEEKEETQIEVKRKLQARDAEAEDKTRAARMKEKR